MGTFDDLVARLGASIAEIERFEEPARERVFELLDGVDALHRLGLSALGDRLQPHELERLREDPAVAWLLDAYGVGMDERERAEAALDSIRPYAESHGGRVEIVDISGGVVRVRMSGTCSGCTASAVTLREGVERALREGLPGFAGLEVEEDRGPSHPPPGPTLLQIGRNAPDTVS